MARARMRAMLQAPDVREVGEAVSGAEALRFVRHPLRQVTQQGGGRATALAGRLTAPEKKAIRKLEVSDRTQAAVKAVRLGLVEAAGHGSER
jgi:hypothetical protein